MFHTASIELPTSKKSEMIDVTKRVRAIVSASGVQNGLCSIFCGHTTGAVTINENTDPDVQTDILNALERAVPRSDRSKGGRPPFALVLMFKTLVLQTSHNLSDERTDDPGPAVVHALPRPRVRRHGAGREYDLDFS